MQYSSKLKALFIVYCICIVVSCSGRISVSALTTALWHCKEMNCLTLSLQNFFYQNLHSMAEFLFFLLLQLLLQNSHKHCLLMLRNLLCALLKHFSSSQNIFNIEGGNCKTKKVQRLLDTVSHEKLYYAASNRTYRFL